VSTPLLKTKLYVPPVRSELVPRPHLIERLDRGVREGHKLTLISAPAGYGKTTLLSEWVAQSEQPVAWVSLDDSDNDPTRFWAYAVAALRTVSEDIREIARAPLQPAYPPAIEPGVTELLNQLAELRGPIALVLDDYHVITTPAIHATVSFLLENLPSQMHLVIATRADPPLPIPRLRVQGQLTELYESDLRFTSEETARLLDLVFDLSLSAADVRALEKRTEGWIAGLQMAAISMRGRDDVAEFVRSFTGSHRYVLDYLTEEVLRQQPEDVRQFLLRTAILDRLTAPLCDAVIEGVTLNEARPASQTMLEYLDASNLFIIPLDDERRWYRYHRLFADLLLQRARRECPDLLPWLHRRASEWYEQNGLTSEAVGHALTCGDSERAAQLIEKVAWPMMARCENAALLTWLDALPDDAIAARPRLGVARAWALAVAGKLDAVAPSLAGIDLQQVPGEAAAARAYTATIRGDTRGGIAFARQALEQLPEDDLFLRGFLALNLGIAYFSNGELAAASRALDQAVELSRAADQSDLTIAAIAVLGHVQEAQALLHKAVETHHQVLDLASGPGSRPSPVVGIACLGIARVAYEWNDLETASRYVTEGIELLEQGRFITYLLSGHSLRARLSLAQGDLDAAQAAVQQAQRLAPGEDLAYMTAVLEGLQARLHVIAGDGAAAGRWAQAHRATDLDELDRAREAEQMAVAWVLVAHDGADQVLDLLARLLERAQAAGRIDAAIRILALQALAFQAQDDLPRALSALERALALAEPEGYVRTFVDEGEPMARLLRQALSQGIAPNYAARLLAAFDAEVELTSPAMESLVEPLTERELEVLRLIVAGLSNAEIAEELFIAVSTVKSHVNHIYGKLAVENRIQAVNRARSLELL
jgi:LuxR family maltose regulon positive regulatory protein